MKTLSRERQEKARIYIYTYGRPLEQKLYAMHWGGSAEASVRAELARFQNPDGGFGHALEPDLRLPDSSVIATTVGLQVLRQLGRIGRSASRSSHASRSPLAAPTDDPLVEGAMRYLVQTYDPDLYAWPIIPPNVDDAPHAPWWSYSSELADQWGGFLANPRAEIVGYMYDYAPLVPPDLLALLSAEVEAHLASHPDEWEMHDLMCYVRLIETRALPSPLRDRLMPGLRQAVEATVVRDPAQWGGYCLKPLDVVQSPDSPFAAELAAAVAEQLDFEIARQGADGVWAPAWTWGDLYPEAWPQARRDWSGYLTLRTLRALSSFDRFE